MMILLEQLPAWVWLVPALPLFAVIVNGARVLLGRARGMPPSH
jgi:ABC-type proline/glycine betaine transport system permease subunit